VQGHAVSIAAGNSFALAVTDTGSVAAWGSNSFGQSTVPDAAKSGVVKVVAMDSSAAALKSDGSVVTWGGQTKVGATPAAAMSGVVDVAIGYDSAVALKSDGSLVAWGPGNAHGQQDIPAGAGYEATSLVEGGYFAMTLHQPTAAPTITGTPTRPCRANRTTTR
jgi:alpha-tubulin suppressor-like RCC1 family protein